MLIRLFGINIVKNNVNLFFLGNIIVRDKKKQNLSMNMERVKSEQYSTKM